MTVGVINLARISVIVPDEIKTTLEQIVLDIISVCEDCYERGRADGQEEGRTEGYDDGYGAGYEEGHGNGYSEGYAESERDFADSQT